MSDEEKEIVINNFEDVLKFVNEDFGKVLILLKKYNLIPDEKVKRAYGGKKELMVFLENIVISYLNEKYSDLHTRISVERKKGKDLIELSLKLSSVKFKIKLFKSDLDEQSFNQVVLILDNVKKELDVIESKEKNIAAKK
ncbi:MAG: hypothetical protein PVJ67_03130 [Candidatus Pacearchaeota archaeon]|jgi:hypothetical protein